MTRSLLEQVNAIFLRRFIYVHLTQQSFNKETIRKGD